MATYFVCSGAGATAAPYDTWNKAAVSIPALMTGAAIAGGDIIYVHNTHNYVAGATITWTLPETGNGLVQVICVDGGDAAFTTGGSGMGSTVGNITTGAIENTNGNFAFGINNSNSASALFIHGMTLKAGAGASSSNADINVAASSIGKLVFQGCTFRIDSTTAAALVTIGTTAGGGGTDVEFNGCTFTHGNAGQAITTASGRFFFTNCKLATTYPTTLFISSTSSRSLTIMNGCDWSGATNVLSQAVASCITYICTNCAIGTPTTGTHSGVGFCKAEFHACAPVDGANGADILNYYYEDGTGAVQDDQTIYLTTGSATGEQDDGTDTPYSLLMQPSTSASKATPLYTPWIYVLVGSTGAKTITMKACDAGTDADELRNSELWLEVEYMGEPGATGTQRIANSPHSQIEVDDDCPTMASSIARDVTAAGTDRTDTDEAWTGITETNTYTLTASVTCDEVGYIRCRVGLAFDRDVYVDPKIGVA